MAIPVSEGVHDIRVSYRPEGQVVGIICTLVGMAAAVGYILTLKKVKKND